MQGNPILMVIADLAIPKKAHARVGLYFGGAAEAIVVLDSNHVEIFDHKEVDSVEY